MDEAILGQLAELAKAFNRIGVKPVICGGLGVYLLFHNSEGAARNIIRATNDIDLMITKDMVPENSRRNAIAEIITGQLEYGVCKNKKYFGFTKNPDRYLDILSQPMDGFKIRENRIYFVKSTLHGFLTEEARYIDEDLKTIELASDQTQDRIEVQVPSPTNLLILKLCAFNDRDNNNEEKPARIHALDVYIAVTLANRDDYLEGQKFLARHNDWQVIQRITSIVRDKFGSVDQPGWQRVLEATSFYPNLNPQQKRDELEKAKDRLLRWFMLSEHNHPDR